MKRKSTLIIAVVLILAVSIPMLAMVAGGARRDDTTGNLTNGRYLGQLNDDSTTVPGNQFALGDYLVDEDGYCYALDENGVRQHLYARSADGQYLALRYADGEYCWSNEYTNENTLQTRVANFFGGGCPRWN